jgi:ParB/RepB/Spo0J family partition protein
MTSGNFTYLPVADILINREDRQRRELKGIEELAQSIADNGLINPIVVTRENVLVAGERRLTAHQKLGFETIAIQYMDDLDETALHTIELEENIRRVDLDWPDRVRAVARYHELKETTKEGWTQEDTAKALNLSSTHVSRYLLVDEMIEDGVEEVINSDRLSRAMSYAQRQHERKKTSALRDLRAPVVKKTPAETSDENILFAPPSVATAAPRFAEIQQANFLEFAKEVPETPYNFIHCDFPYGVNTGDVMGYSQAKELGGYTDTAEVYFKLLDTFTHYSDRFIAGSAHLMFWFSMDYYEITKTKLTAGGGKVNPFPLVWFKSDNTGIMPDANRGPRRVYETAFFASRGDRKVVKPISNVAAVPGKRGEGKQFHMSEKALPMLDHFFRMVVDENTVMLDPTCGSGNAVKAAENAGASYALGLEIDPKFVEQAKINLDL